MNPGNLEKKINPREINLPKKSREKVKTTSGF